jgi:hypothetical protein
MVAAMEEGMAAAGAVAVGIEHRRVRTTSSARLVFQPGARDRPASANVITVHATT